MDNNHPQVNFGKTGVLLINLGTPDSTGWGVVGKYLKDFFGGFRLFFLQFWMFFGRFLDDFRVTFFHRTVFVGFFS